MSLLVSSLNSGSNGNCYYIGNGDEAVLIDCGIPCREIERRMKRLGLSIRKLKGVFITHEHTDHISGTNSIAKKYKIPVYLTEKTFSQAILKVAPELINYIQRNDTITIGDLTIESFAKSHDAAEPVCFHVKSRSVTVGVYTDLGYSDPLIVEKFSQCHAAFLEANYDEDMLRNGYYPWHLQERIRGNFGHLSNEQALQLLREHRAPFMSHVFLSHLSKHNNSQKLVKKVFEPMQSELEVIIATRAKETALFHIRGGVVSTKKLPTRPAEQLNLF